MTRSRRTVSVLACLFALLGTVAGAKRVQAGLTHPAPADVRHGNRDDDIAVARPLLAGDLAFLPDWPVYLDDTWAYSIQYPPDWNVAVVFTNASDRPLSIIRQRTAFSGPMDAEVSVDVWEKNPRTDLIQWLDANERTFLELGGVQLPIAPNATIAGQPAVVLSQAGGCASPQLFFAYVDAGDRMLLVQYTARDAGGALDTYRTMLESLFIATLGAPLSKATDSIPDLPLTVTLAAVCEYAPNEDGCCGYPQVPHWQCSRDTTTKQHLGNCTYWAAYKRSDIAAVVGSGYAGQWAEKAHDADCDVDATPRAGDIMVIEANPGHVAYVTGVSGTTVNVTEMNWCTVCPQRAQSYSSSGKRFIHACGGTGDTTAPDGNITNPSAGATITSRTARLDGWGQDNPGGSGFGHAHFTATWPGVGWHQIGGDFNTSPFGFDWDMCNDGVPDGTVTIGLSIWDQAGNEANPPHAVRNFTKSYNCGPTPTHLQCQNNACVRVDGAGSDQCSSNLDCAPPSGQWQVEYFSDTNLSNRCSGPNYQSGTFVFRDWRDGSPAEGSCPSNYWSARFRRTVHFQSGYYTFGLGADDWGRIRVGGNLVVDKWQASNQHYEGKSLSEGDYEVIVEFADTEGLAWIVAWWWGPGFNTPREARDPEQWYAHYYGFSDPEYWDPIVSVNEGYGDLDHAWDTNGPGYGLPQDRFASRFERRAYFDCGTYRFHVFTDDGARLKIDGQLKLSEWRHPQVQGYDVYVDLTAGYHELQVDHYDEDGSAAISLRWYLQSRCPLNAPSNLTATAASQSQINLSWQDNSGDESDFHIERSPTGGGSWTEIGTAAANATSYQNTGLSCGTSYWYRVRAHRHGDGQYSSYSNTPSATTQACSGPSAPTNMTATAVSQTQINLSWQDNSGDESDFHIERSPTGSGSWTEIGTAAANATSYQNTGLSCGTSYWYRVRAHRHGDGQYSSYSSVDGATTQACGGGWSVFIPLVMRNFTYVPPVWANIMTENFEGAFPTGDWWVFDQDGATSGEYYWDDDDFKPYQGGRSAWPANGGVNGLDPQYNDYPNDLNSWMIYGPFSLSDALDAELHFYYWIQSELDYDYLCWGASVNGTDFYATCVTGDSQGWGFENFDLTSVGTLGDLRGEPEVWVAFAFYSDYSITYQGAFVDNIILREQISSVAAAAGLAEEAVSSQPPTTLRIDTNMAISVHGQTDSTVKGPIPTRAPAATATPMPTPTTVITSTLMPTVAGTSTATATPTSTHTPTPTATITSTAATTPAPADTPGPTEALIPGPEPYPTPEERESLHPS